MKNRHFKLYYFLTCVLVLIASYYPLSMGVRVVRDMITQGTVMQENYPKYIIPYTPISIAVIIGVLLMPLCIRFFKRFALLGSAAISTGTFFLSELLLERKVIVTTAETVTVLESWQMFMCYQPPGGWGTTKTVYKEKTAVEILMGDYSPAFKLHFYIISVVLILCLLNCIYGFGQMVKTGDKKRRKALILQLLCTLSFLGLCILACFTAFWRDGSIMVSPLSATLMAVFFILMGVTVGVFAGSFLLEKKKAAIWVSAATAAVITVAMYIGEMILLHGNLYLLGTGFFFRSIPGIVLSPMDILIILLSGGITAAIFKLLTKHK